jgi:hypothetical protein
MDEKFNIQRVYNLWGKNTPDVGFLRTDNSILSI